MLTWQVALFQMSSVFKHSIMLIITRKNHVAYQLLGTNSEL